MLRSNRWTELTTKEIDGYGKDRAVELGDCDDGGTTEAEGRSEGGEEEEEDSGKALNWLVGRGGRRRRLR